MSKKKSKPWTCKKGCKATHKPCKHLERLLRPSRDGFRSFGVSEIQVNSFDPVEFEEKLSVIRSALVSKGIEEFRVDIILDRYISRLTLKEIKESRGFYSEYMIKSLIETTLPMIKALGPEVFRELMKEEDDE